MKTLLLAGTKKGLFVFTSTDRHDWQLHGPFQTGREINHAIYDSRSGRIYATSNDAWFGCEMVWSSDLGESWAMAKQNPGFAESAGMKLERIWHVEPGRPSEPQVLYAGVARGDRTSDRGRGQRGLALAVRQNRQNSKGDLGAVRGSVAPRQWEWTP